jgi:hypothetical protein
MSLRAVDVAVTLGLFFTVPRVIADYIDPQGGKVQRSVFKRFWTITVPDNALFFAYAWCHRITDWTAVLKDPTVMLVLATVIFGSAKLVDFVRREIALQFDALAAWLTQPSIGHYIAGKTAKYIGPRDFYAWPPEPTMLDPYDEQQQRIAMLARFTRNART